MIKYFLIFLVISCVTKQESVLKSWEVADVALMPTEYKAANTSIIKNGIMTVNQQLTHFITYRPRYKIRDFSIWSCGREVFFTDTIKTQTVEYRYQPTFEIEQDSLCPLFAYSISDTGKKELSIINFKNKNDNLKMRVYCNGESVDATGAWLCQMRTGLTMGIKAFEFVDVQESKNCKPPKKTGLQKYEIIVERNFCSYTFLGKDSKDFFVLTNRGYARND